MASNPVLSALGDGDRYLSVAEVARLLGVTVETVRRRVKDGTLPVVRLNSRLQRIRWSVVAAYLAEHE